MNMCFIGTLAGLAASILESASILASSELNTVAATIQGNMFKIEYRIKRVELAWHHQDRFKRKLVLFLRFSLKSNFRIVVPPPQG